MEVKARRSEARRREPAPRYRIGIDVGGTFTDFLLAGPHGLTAVHKELSTPADPSEAVLAGLAALARGQGLEPAQFLRRVALIVHGTTVTTNAVLTGRTARTGLVTTKGFRDALEMRRGVREEMYDNRWHAPAPLVPRWLRLPVAERIGPAGEVIAPLDAAGAEQALAQLREAGVEAVAICFLHAHANPAHERSAAALARRALPQAYVSVSSEVLPQVRFYERVSTTVFNAAVGPILARYLASLTRRLDEAGFGGTLLVMQSNGGVGSPAEVVRRAAATLLSGPAAAPAAGLACLASSGERSFISVDMGGTSFDAALVRDGAPEVTSAGTVNRYALALPAMEIHTIGAGGGSIGWIDEGGLLRMGPQSAGADPGPACYGRGGTEPTCTDANLVLGYLSADYFAGGRMRLDAAAARRAIEERIARPLGLSLAQAAHGMLHVINVNMASAIREISVKKGYDPREFPLLCAGGAGPLHAAAIAAELGIRRVIVPRDASIFCASGMLRSDLRHDYVRSCAQTLGARGEGGARVREAAREMLAEADRALAAEGVPRARRRMRFLMDLRYSGQYHEVTVEVPREAVLRADWNAVRERFHDRHDRLYGYCLRQEGTAVELLNVRLAATGITPKPVLAREPRARAEARGALKGRRPAYLPEKKGYREVPVYDGDRLRRGNRLAGPAIIECANTTIVVPAGWRAEYDALGNCILSVMRAK
jgi:N-methylhydantoinase A